MHLVAIYLNLVSTDHTDVVVVLKDFLDRLEAKLDRAFTLRIFSEAVGPRIFVVNGVSPKQVAEEALEGGLLEPVDLVDVACIFEFLRDASVHA